MLKLLFSDNLDSDLGFDVLVDVNLSGESADLFEFCTIHNNLLAVDVVVVLLLQGLSNLVAGDGAEEVAVLTDLGDKAAIKSPKKCWTVVLQRPTRKSLKVLSASGII